MRRRHQLRPDTFPFLAVLLCAMGSLILVLMEFDRRARSSAHHRAEAAWKQQEQEKAELRARLRAQKIAELEQQRDAALAAHQKERDDLQHRHQTLSAEQQKTQAQIDAILRSIAAGREQLERAEQQRQQLQSKAETTKGVLTARHAQTEQVRQRLKTAHSQRDRMADDLLALEESLKRLQEQRERARQKWSVVPYVGKRGLSRRPLYVEIASDKIIFHPDRLTLSAFLLSDQRVREEVRSRGEAHKKNAPAGAPVEEPYWMLLVRPDGIETYYGFLAAVKSMELTYGYEFVEKDWDFDFPDTKSAPEPVKVVTPLPTPARPTLGPPRGVGAAGPKGSSDTVAGVQAHGGSPGGVRGVGPAGSGGFPSPRAGGSDLVGDGSGDTSEGTSSGQGRNSIGIGPIGLPPVAIGTPVGSGQGGGTKGSDSNGSPAMASGVKPGGNGSPGARGEGSPGGGASPAPRAGGSDRVGEEPGDASEGTPSGQGRDSNGIGSVGLPPATIGTPGSGGQGVGTNGSESTGSPASASGESTSGKGSVPAPPAQEDIADPKTTSRIPAPPNPASGPPGNGDGNGDGGGDFAGSGGQGSSVPVEEVPTQPGKGGKGNAVRGSKSPPKVPPRLRPEWVLLVDCRSEGVMMSPGRQFFSLTELARSKGPGRNRLARQAGKLIAQRRALVPQGEPPPRIVIRFLVRQETLRTYHLTYPLLDALDAEKRAVMSNE